MKYSIDTSAILHGWRRAYPPDVFPAFWKKFDELVQNGDIVATEEVLHELKKKDDEVYSWVVKRKKMFLEIDNEIQVAVQEVLKIHYRLIDTRKNRSGADPFVIALAKVHGCSVVTNEMLTSSVSRPHIPDVCNTLGIKWLNLLDLIRTQKWVF